jgi:hypothetical protein
MSSIETPGELSFLDRAQLDSRDFMHLARYGDTDWIINNSSINDYSSKAHFPDDSLTLGEAIRTRLGTSEANVGLDIVAGSNGTALQDLMRSGVLSKAIMTNYEDMRNAETVAIPELYQVEGDLTSTSTWQQIIALKQEHAPQGLAIAMHRPAGALQNLSPSIYRGATHLVLNMLGSGGLFFTQVPRSLIDPKWRNRHALERICREVEARDDVSEVVVSKPGTSEFADRRDTYAMIFKAGELLA